MCSVSVCLSCSQRAPIHGQRRRGGAAMASGLIAEVQGFLRVHHARPGRSTSLGKRLYNFLRSKEGMANPELATMLRAYRSVSTKGIKPPVVTFRLREKTTVRLAAASAAGGSDVMHAAADAVPPAAASAGGSDDMHVAAESIVRTAEILHKKAADLLVQEIALTKRERALEQREDRLPRVRVQRARRS